MKNALLFLLALSLFSLKSTAQTVTDIDGNIYDTVIIGAQIWLKQNLKTTKYNNGVDIPTTSLPINNNASAIYQWSYDDDSTNIDTYGRLYTWNVANNTNNVCPTGWHVPDNSDWETLRDYLGGGSIAGAKMKEVGTTHWNETDSTVTNSSGFTALGGGFRGNPSGFNNLGTLGSFWSTTPFGTTDSFPRGTSFNLYANNNTFLSSVAVSNNGKSIRCIKTVTTGVNDTSIPNQLQVYPNPAINQITVSSEAIRDYNLTIYDILGNKVLQQQVANNTTPIDIAHLSKGTYFIQLESKNQVVSSTFIKQ